MFCCIYFSLLCRAYKDSFIENNDLTVCFDPSIKELRRENVFSTNGLDTSVNDADSAATGYQLSGKLNGTLKHLHTVYVLVVQ